jgi:hypothetical protein
VKRRLLALALVGAVLSPASALATPNNPNNPAGGGAWVSNSFQSPSANIRCHYWPATAASSGTPYLGPTLTCTTLNTGLTVYLTPRLRAGSRYAHLDEGHGPTLGYGQRWVISGYSCDSESAGMTCRSSSGPGFTVNRSDFEVW